MHEIFALPIFRRALIALFATGVAFPTLGTFILCLELIPARFAVMHASLLGASLGLLVGMDPMGWAMGTALASGLGIARMSERSSASAGGSLGLVMTATLGLSFILFYKANVDSMEAFNLFWGNVLTLSPGETAMTVAGALLILTLTTVFHKEILAVLYDRELASTLGLPARPVYYGIILLVCLGIGLAIRLTGALMVDAVTLLPALAARSLNKPLRSTLRWGALFGLVSNMGGFALAFALDLPTSPAIIVTGTLLVWIVRLTQRGNRGRA